MPQNSSTGDGSCCAQSIRGLRRLTFPDGTEVGITGMDAVMEKLYREGRPADEQIAADIMAQLKSENYFEPSARQAYEELFLREYRRFLERRRELAESPTNTSASDAESQKAKKRCLFRCFKRGQETAKD